jgi:Holliday junction resolvase RusA-like endonuclease
MQYSGEKYDYLFDQTCEDILNIKKELNHKFVGRYRVRIIKSGRQLELEIYPLWNDYDENRKARRATTREAQKNLNDKNAKLRVQRLIDANFTSEDICITLSYKGSSPDEKTARRDIRNYLRRVKDYREKNGLPELKYIYVIEYLHEGSKKNKRIHHHVIMSGMDRDVAEELWKGKGWANTRRLQPDDNGLVALAKYITKAPNGGKRWASSRNLLEPEVKVNDTKISRRKVEQMVFDFENKPREIFEKLFPDYSFNDCTIKRSEFVAGAYIYARMRSKLINFSQSQQKKRGKKHETRLSAKKSNAGAT